jgi:long-chain acyl-CoA synthetase
MKIRETIIGITQARERNVFLVDANTGREITYGEFHLLACAVASDLARRGVRKGDRVAVVVPNGCELAVLYFACIYLGAVVVPINPLLSANDVRFILSNSKTKAVVTTQSLSGLMRTLHSNVIEVTNYGDTSEHSRPVDLLSIWQSSPGHAFVPLEDASADDPIAIMYTSGTSAKPKGLVHKIGSMFRNALAFADMQRIDKDSRFYLTLSMAYMGGFYNLLILPFLCGASVVVDRVFDARSSLGFWEKAKRNNVNTLWFAPTVMSILLRMDRGHLGEDFCRTSVRHAFVGFAPLSLKVKNEFEGRYGLRLIENYGLSETLFVSARAQNTVAEGYVGEAIPGVEVRIANDDGVPVSPGVDGEIQILTPDLMAGYLDSEGDLREVNASSWFSTGDIGRIDHEGSLFVTGRKKDLIIRGGINISPAAIEDVLMQLEGVAEVAVVSMPHEFYGEDVVAVLKLQPSIQLESILDALIACAKRNLAQYQQPARYLIMDEFPRTANGKVQKSRIRDFVAEKFQLSVISKPQTAHAENAALAG